MIGQQIKKSFLNVVGSIPNAFSNMFDKILFEGMKFKDAMKQMLKDLLRQIVSIGTFAIAKAGLALITGGVGFLNYPTGGFTMPTGSDVVNGVTQRQINSIGRKLDSIVQAIDNFIPIQTQVIDLPTLANANTIGSGMIIQGL